MCVHGNPTWSLLWRSMHHRLGDRYRVIAVDQLGMGFSDRTGPRCFARRVDDLGDVVAALDLDEPVVVAAHDWGGPISLGWAVAHRDQVAGIVLCNTGVAVPAGRRAPGIIRLAASGPITDLVGHRTRAFVDGTLALSHGRVGAAARDGYRAPYRRAADRHALAEFIGDIPLRDTDPPHPSAAPIAEVAEAIRSLTVPVLLAWGARDPVFNDDFALDLAERMPHADRHRFRHAGHLVVEEADVAGLVDGWLADGRLADGRLAERAPATSGRPSTRTSIGDAPPVWSALAARAADPSTAMGTAFVDGSTGEAVTFAELHRRVNGIAAGLTATGVQPGQRIAVLIPPSVDLVAAVYGCWRAGAVTVIADRGLGLRGLGGAVRAAHVDWVVGPPSALAAARTLRWAPHARSIAVHYRRVLGAVATLDELAASTAPVPPEPSPSDVAAVLYTSGATGPAKGVRYLHGQMAAQRDALAGLYGISADDRLVAAFAPFAMYGPALGITSTIPDVDVTKPGMLTAEALAVACAAVDATIVFASPAALANVVRTSVAPDPRLARIRLALSAGAPVPIATLRAVARLMPSAELHTPYGMTECLPVADHDLVAIEAAGRGRGVCVGRPVDGVSVRIAPLGFDPTLSVDALASPSTGEVLVQAPWCSDGYDQLWRTEHDARPSDVDGQVWHRSGDVGHVDSDGRLWIEGRSVHVIHAVDGPVTPVPVEVAVECLDGVDSAAAVGIGPVGCQQLVVVVQDPHGADGLADDVLTGRVRAAVSYQVAAVMTLRQLPVDIRHNTKVDRTAVAEWAGSVLAGDSARAPR